MKVTPAQYLAIIESLIQHRPTITAYEFRDLLIEEREGLYSVRLWFYDDSYLDAREHFIVSHTQDLIVIVYRFQYCSAQGESVMRFDNAPHYPHLPGFPHHVHLGNRVQPSEPMTLGLVLDQIEHYLFSSAG